MVKVLVSFLTVVILSILTFFIQQQALATYIPKYPTIKQLDSAIAKAEKYYEGLYRPLGNNMAVMAEYYTPKTVDYTVRHGVIGGYYYFSYLHEATKAAKLKNLIDSYGFTPSYDDHSFIWTKINNAPIGVTYSSKAYHDCFVSLPHALTISPYHSKVCKLGEFGMQIYFFFSHFDPLSGIETALQTLEHKKEVNITNYEKLFDTLGYGIPICTPLGCQDEASTIRTAQFGVLALRKNEMKYADKVAFYLLKAQRKDGAVYIAYDKNGGQVNDRSLIYKIINLFFSDKSLSNKPIPTNAETMNDVLAFLLQYRQARYTMCTSK